MSTPIATDPLARLATLAAQRTSRTQSLYVAVRALLETLEDHVDVGESVTVDGAELSLTRRRSNVGTATFFAFCRSQKHNSVLLDWRLGEEGYLHGDFGCPLRGPSRADLIAFARRASQFVDALVKRAEADLADLASAEAAALAAASSIA